MKGQSLWSLKPDTLSSLMMPLKSFMASYHYEGVEIGFLTMAGIELLSLAWAQVAGAPEHVAQRCDGVAWPALLCLGLRRR
jgi:hypothetical protein